MNVTRPQNHVSVPPSLEINLVLTSYSGIRPCLMAPCHSITTALYTLESLSLPTELSRAFASIPLIQITNKDSTMYILILMGSGVSRILLCHPAKGLFIFLRDCSLLNNVSMQNTQVSETKEFRCSYCRLHESKNEFKSFTVSVMCYRGAVVAPKWKDVDPC
jgi:hypothetical protein